MDRDVSLPNDARPHLFSNTEWWYSFAFVQGDRGGHYAVMSSFFRVGELENLKGHYLIFSLIDLDNFIFQPFSIIDSKMLFSMLSAYLPYYLLNHPKDDRTKELYTELLKLKLPLPHKRMGNVLISSAPTSIRYGNKSLVYNDEKKHIFDVNLSAGDIEMKLEFTPEKPISLIGINGKPDNLYYYSFTKNKVTGSIKRGSSVENLSGRGWFDHQWGNEYRLLINSGWCWFGIQLDDGRELLINQFKYVEKDKTYAPMANLIDSAGSLRFTRNVVLKALKYWQSSSTGAKYPIEWNIFIPEFYMSINVRAIFEDQEMPIIGPLQAIWEGACMIEAEENLPQRGVSHIRGKGFMELVGYANYNAKIT